MQLFQLKLSGFSCPLILQDKILRKNKVKFEISNTSKSMYFPEQTIISTNESDIYNIVAKIIGSNSDIVLSVDNNILTLSPKFLTKLIIEHDIVLDVFSDNDEETAKEFSEYLKSLSVYHTIDEKLIFTLSAQKCLLESKYINDIISYIMFGSKAESSLEMYEFNKYSITQRSGYQKYLK